MQLSVKLLSSTALAAAAMIMAVPMASAQDIGALEKRVKALEKSGSGQDVRRSKRSVTLTVNGHMNRAIQLRDNGTASGFTNVTLNTSRTRVRWLARGKINDDMSAGSNIELGNQSAVSTAQDLADNGDADGAGGIALDTRIVEVYIQSNSLGRVTLGQGYTAASLTGGADLSGTAILSNNASPGLIAGSEGLQSNGVALGITNGSRFSDFDPPRRERIQYNTPKFSGFQVRMAYLNGDAWDAGLFYGASLGGVRIAARIGYNDTESINNLTVVTGSASVLLPFGLNFTIAAGDRDSETAGAVADQSEFWYGKIGYRFNALELGQTRLYLDYTQADDIAALNEEATAVGFGVVQIVEPLGMELYLGYLNIDVDLAANAASDDIDVITAGIRLSF